MADVERQVAAPRAVVWGVLADGWLLSAWVVGTSHIRAVDPQWPAVGSRIHHAAGAWPFLLRDESRVLACEPDRRLSLVARGRPLGEARVDLRLDDEAGGTRVRMHEEPTSGPGRLLHNPVAELLLHHRNVESLSRLAALATRPTEP